MDTEPKTEEAPRELESDQYDSIPSGNSGCYKQLGKGCLITFIVLLVLGSIGAIVIYRSVQKAGGWKSYLNKKSAEYMQYAVKANLENLPLNKHEKESISAPMAILADKMRIGQIDAIKSVKLVQAAYHTSLPEVLMLLSFQAKRIKPENKAAALTVNRVLNGLLSGKITPSGMVKFNQIVLNKPEQLDKIHSYKGDAQDPSKEIEFKELTQQDVDLAVRTLGELADRAGMPKIRQDLNFTPIIMNLINSISEESSSPKKVENK